MSIQSQELEYITLQVEEIARLYNEGNLKGANKILARYGLLFAKEHWDNYWDGMREACGSYYGYKPKPIKDEKA